MERRIQCCECGRYYVESEWCDCEDMDPDDRERMLADRDEAAIDRYCDLRDGPDEPRWFGGIDSNKSY